MGARYITLVACGLALAANPSAQQKTDQDKIQGTWKLESGIMGGKAMPEEVVKSAKIVFEGNKMKATGTMEGKTETHEMTFKLDPTKNPKAIDVEINGQPGLGIYSLEGDTLKICHGEGKDPRPTEFASKEGTGYVMAVFKRVK